MNIRVQVLYSSIGISAAAAAAACLNTKKHHTKHHAKVLLLLSVLTACMYVLYRIIRVHSVCSTTVPKTKINYYYCLQQTDRETQIERKKPTRIYDMYDKCSLLFLPNHAPAD